MEAQVPSLQQMALRKLAINLWNAFLSESRPSLTLIQNQLEFLTNKVKEKVPLVGLPSSIAEKLSKEIAPIGVEIRRWKKYHRSLIPLKVAKNALKQLCWTSEGTVDYCKTAETLIRQRRLNDFNCYKLSCLYCFEEDIRKFWFKIPGYCKRLYYSENTHLRDQERMQVNLIHFWSHFLEGDRHVLMNENEPQGIFQYAFEQAAFSGNKTATEYFLQKLSDLEKDAFLVTTAHCVVEMRVNYIYIKPMHCFPRKKYCEVLIFLLHQMSEIEQAEFFKKKPGETLICFLDWPWQDFFIKVTEHLWPFLGSRSCAKVLGHFSKNRKHPQYDYMSLFGEFFLRVYGHYRNDLVDRPWLNMMWFKDLFLFDMREYIQLVLESLSGEEKERLIVSSFGIYICWMLLEEENWLLLEIFITECNLSREAKIRLKDSFREEWELNNRRNHRNEFLQIVDNLERNFSNKRFMEESESEQLNKKR